MATSEGKKQKKDKIIPGPWSKTLEDTGTASGLQGRGGKSRGTFPWTRARSQKEKTPTDKTVRLGGGENN